MMVKLTKIYTRGGDQGETSLGNGERTAKHSLRVEAYGTVDEINAAIGLVRMEICRSTTVNPLIDIALQRIQNDLFDLGADLCTPKGKEDIDGKLRISATQVDWLEAEIDRFNDQLCPLNSFILPGGAPVASQLHLARTVTRRAERSATCLAETEIVNPEAIKFLNRLSDLLFVMSRTANKYGKDDVLWVPGENR